MGFMDKAKDMINQHEQKIDDGLDKAADAVKKKTGGKYDDKIDRGVDTAQDKTGNL